ncbi:MAG: DALR domain-containing protein [Solirubrobacterales bacterium]
MGARAPPPPPRLDAFRDALADDFNTPRAMAEAFELVAEANRSEAARDAAGEILSQMLDLVGLSSLTQPDEGAEVGEDATKLMAEREEARAARDFERADALRDQLAELGWTVRDSAEGPTLVPKA